MSRHEIEARDGRYAVAVGWDRPLNSYFCQVEDLAATDDAEAVILWLGAGFGEIADPVSMISHLAPFAELTAEAIEQLRQDRAAGG